MLESLSQELKDVVQRLADSGITNLNEAEDVLKAVELLKKARIPHKEWQKLVGVSEELGDPEFRKAVFALLGIERKFGKNYKEIVSYLENLASEIREKEERVEKLDVYIGAKERALNGLKSELSDLRRKVGEEKAGLEKELKKDGMVRERLQDGKLDISLLILVAQELASLPEEREVARKLKEIKTLGTALSSIAKETEAKKESLSELSIRETQLKKTIASLDKEISDYYSSILSMIAENRKLRPLETFLDIPCCKCQNPMSNNWTREQVLQIFKDWGHKNCIEGKK